MPTIAFTRGCGALRQDSIRWASSGRWSSPGPASRREDDPASLRAERRGPPNREAECGAQEGTGLGDTPLRRGCSQGLRAARVPTCHGRALQRTRRGKLPRPRQSDGTRVPASRRKSIKRGLAPWASRAPCTPKSSDVNSGVRRGSAWDIDALGCRLRSQRRSISPRTSPLLFGSASPLSSCQMATRYAAPVPCVP